MLDVTTFIPSSACSLNYVSFNQLFYFCVTFLPPPNWKTSQHRRLIKHKLTAIWGPVSPHQLAPSPLRRSDVNLLQTSSQQHPNIYWSAEQQRDALITSKHKNHSSAASQFSSVQRYHLPEPASPRSISRSSSVAESTKPDTMKERAAAQITINQ